MDSMCSLPTLLLRSHSEPLSCKRRRPAPLDSTLFIKNTFIEDVPPCSPSIAPFYRERTVQSCPARHIGRVVDASFQEASTPVGEFQLPSPCQIQTPCGFQAPSAEAWLRPVQLCLTEMLGDSCVAMPVQDAACNAWEC